MARPLGRGGQHQRSTVVYPIRDLTRGAALNVIQQDPGIFYSYLDVQQGQHILDIGSGTGDLTRPLAQLVGSQGRVVGVDYSQTMVDEARRRNGDSTDVEFLQGDVNSLDFPDNAFDRVQVRLVFQHLKDPYPALREIIRVTKPGGKIAVVEQDWESLLIDATDRHVTRTIANLLLRQPAQWLDRKAATRAV